MKTAIYYNTKLGETYRLAGVKDLAHAWLLAEFACARNGWHPLDLKTIKLI